jgi:two-component system LytT family sensor kinase
MRRKTIFYHLLGWTIYLLIIALSADKVDGDFILKNVSGTLPVIAIFYINTGLIFPTYLELKKYLVAILLTIFVCVVTVGIRVGFIAFYPGHLPAFDAIMFWVQFRFNVLFAGISTAYWYGIKHYEGEKKWQQLEKELADAKLSFLKNQINPHFLYNSLSLLYSKTLPLSAEVSSLVGKIAEMLRYSLDDADGTGLAPLEKEVTHVKNYLDIQRLRFNNTLHIVFEVSGDTANRWIAPLMLITFVENAFKHGRFNEEENPVVIKLNITDTEINFTVKNPKATGMKEKSSGIGLVNVKSRLHLLYPNSHSLEINDEKQTYSVNLKIKNTA